MNKIFENDRLIVCKYGSVYRVHFFGDEDTRKKINDLKSFITKDINKVRKIIYQ